VAGPVEALVALAAALAAGEMSLRYPLDAVLAFTGSRHGKLTDLERDLFWRVFRAPVFEQFHGPNGRLVAMECQAHAGLHLFGKNPAADGLNTAVDATLCGCGAISPRLKRLAREGETAAA
jgi:hypothetical protein